MAEDARLTALTQSLARIIGCGPADAAMPFGDLELNSHHLVELMIACDEIYGAEVAFESLDITPETTVVALHGQIVEQKETGLENKAPHPG